MSELARQDMAEAQEAPPRPLIYRQSVWTRLTHWLWAVALFFLLLSGLNIFNAHPTLYVGRESGFAYDNAVLKIDADFNQTPPAGFVEVLGRRFDTTGLLGISERDGEREVRAFPYWATIPSFYDLATARVVHFFFAWMLSATLLVWLAASLLNGHARRDVVPGRRDLRRLPRDVADHLRLRFRHTREYNPLQKLSYAGVLFVALPLMILTGLSMSPSFNAVAPLLLDLFGGRQTARTIHFVTMLALVLFFVVHVVMVVAAGPFNELRSIITGWYRADRETRP
ncbi:MAG: cytochrome b/b6 domain-containing protein [Methylobacterium mesophilicum]|nr:cytochrome b/b6 domain-containing protein [Methylobacterium mesophilicum]